MSNTAVFHPAVELSASSSLSRTATAIIVIALHAVALLLILGASATLHTVSPATPSQLVMLDLTEHTQVESKLSQTVAPIANYEPPAPALPTIEIAASDNAAPIVVQSLQQDPRPISTGEQAPITVSQVEYVRPPVLVYPPLSKKLREQGIVVLRVMIDERGCPDQIEVHNSSGFPRLDAAATQAVRLAAFKPYEAGGIARRVYVLIPLEYALRS